MATKALVQRIVTKLEKSLHPDSCSWGQEYQRAYNDLFQHYKEDIILDIKKILDEASLTELASS